MKESKIEWAKVEEFKKNKVINTEERHNFVFDEKQECENYIEIKYSILKYTTGNEYYYQRIVELPFACKSGWTTTKPDDKSIITLVESKLRQKYKNILTRNYKNIKDFEEFKEEIAKGNIARDKYINELYHGSSTDKINDQYIGDIWKKIESGDKKVYKYSDVKNPDDILSWDKFVKMMTQDNCGYCGVSIEQINKISNYHKLYTKRSRGYTLEIDQKEPNNGYKDDNCVACCYWCNNAKTDEFSVEDFKEIAKGINIVWNKRLGPKKGFDDIVKFPFNTYK